MSSVQESMLWALKNELEREYSSHIDAIDDDGDFHAQCELYAYTGLLLDARSSALQKLITGSDSLKPDPATESVAGEYIEYVNQHEPKFNGDVHTRLCLLRQVLVRLDPGYVPPSHN